MFKVRREDLHNFTREENGTLTRMGPATAMGNLFRQYWIPVVPTPHLSEPGGRPVRVKEHLCAGDISTIKARLKLLNAAKALRENSGVPLGGLDAGVYRVRGASVVVPNDTSWVVGVQEAITVPPLVN
jgi:hypothetical protein